MSCVRTASSCIFLFICILSAAIADWPHELLVTVRAQAQKSPPQIQFSWENFGASVNIYKIDPLQSTGLDGNVWGRQLAALPAGTTTWVDTSVVVGRAYEYRFEFIDGSVYISTFFRNAYIYAGIDIEPIHQRGRVLLIVDDTLSSALQNELAQLEEDLIGDGWLVTRQDLSPNLSGPALRSAIAVLYQQSPQDTKVLYLLGHLRITKSGCINPDGHEPQPQATDAYYADVDGIWTDIQTFSCSPGNRPGDGRFDQLAVPSAVEMGAGRVDFWNMPAYTETPTELVRRYLEKAHRYKQRDFTPGLRTIVFNQAQSLTAGLNVIPVTGAWDILDMNVQTTPRTDLWVEMQSKPFLWLFKGGGGGTGDGMAQIGTSGTFAASTGVLVPFWGVLGSGNGYWDRTDAFSRGVIASRGMTLAYMWSDRPIWRLHNLGSGKTFGDGMAQTVNNSGKYSLDLYTHALQASLMGDPTLHIQYVTPVSLLSANSSTQGVTLTWTPSIDASIGYYVYRAADKSGPYTLLNEVPLSTTTFTDTTAPSGTQTYMLRVAKREVNGSGSFINLSQGKFVTVQVNGTSRPQAPSRLRLIASN